MLTVTMVIINILVSVFFCFLLLKKLTSKILFPLFPTFNHVQLGTGPKWTFWQNITTKPQVYIIKILCNRLNEHI